MRNNNGAIVRKITRRSLSANKKRNFFIAVAIMLTGFMLASVFSVGISLIESITISPFRLEGTLAHMGAARLNEAQIEKLHNLDYVTNIGESARVAHAEFPHIDDGMLMVYIDRNTWENFSSPTFTNIVGHYGEDGNWIKLSRHKLSEMGIENAYVGMEITLSFTPLGSDASQTETFTLAAIYTEFVSAHRGAFTPIFVSRSFAERHGQIYPENMNYQIIFRSLARAMDYAEQLASDLELDSHWLMGVNTAVLAAATFSPVPVYISMGVIIVFLMLTGFLLIYNVMYVSVSKDVRFYGLLKTLGTTPKQLRRIVNGQVLRLYLIGLPVGLLLAAAASFIFVPMFVTVSTESVISFSPVIYLGGAGFTLLTAYFGAFTSARKAARVSPIEALRYTGEQLTKVKHRASARGKVSRMAFRNVFREKKRAFVVLASLFLGITVFTVVMTMVNSLDTDYAVMDIYDHDFTISSTVFGTGLESEFIDNITQLPYVEEVRPDFLTAALLPYDERISRYVTHHVEHRETWGVTREMYVENGMYFTVRGIDSAWLSEWNDGQAEPFSPADIEAFKRGELMFMDVTMLGLLYHLSHEEIEQVFPIGTVFDMMLGIDEMAEPIQISAGLGGFADFRHNTGMRFAVGGAVVQFHMYGGFLENLLGENLRILHINVNATAGMDGVLNTAITAMLSPTHEMVSRYELRQRLAEERQAVMVLGTGLSAILGIIGIFNFINVISVGLLVREREFAALESVGMAKTQMRKMLRWEGAIYWITTIALSLILGNGIAFGIFTLADNAGHFAGFTYPLIPIAIAYALIIVICSVTPEIAYRSMSKTSLVERLREA